jgi:glycosyltransferase involved in cell wall biosynthesis
VRRLTYSVVTPVRNESENLRRLQRWITAQTVTPNSWVIVDTGSTDDSLEIARAFERELAWIRVLALPPTDDAGRGAPVVRAFHAGLGLLDPLPDVIVKVDADVSMGEDYFCCLLEAFASDARLGIASGSAYELDGGAWRQRHVTRSSVWGASRAYRWSCLAAILPLEERMGWDGIDEVQANARGWRTRTLTDLPFRHHRREGEREGRRRAVWTAEGEIAHYMHYRASYLLLRTAFRAAREPTATAMLWGYSRAALARAPRCPDDAARRYLRQRQSLREVPLRVREALGA